MGLRHSQEEIFIEAQKLETIGVELCKIEKELREGLGLRKTERKGEWKVANTIDLIKVVLEEWGCGVVESIIKMKKVDKKPVRLYSVHINKTNKMWNKLYFSNNNYDNNLIII